MKSRIAFGVCALLVLAVIAIVGRVERSRWTDAQNAGIARVRADVAASFRHPSASRGGPAFACLIWRTPGDPYGRELCYAPTGALVEAILRVPRHDPSIWTLRPDPGAARVRDDPRVIAHLLDRLGAQTGDSIQIGMPDLGPR